MSSTNTEKRGPKPKANQEDLHALTNSFKEELLKVKVVTDDLQEQIKARSPKEEESEAQVGESSLAVKLDKLINVVREMCHNTGNDRILKKHGIEKMNIKDMQKSKWSN